MKRALLFALAAVVITAISLAIADVGPLLGLLSILLVALVAAAALVWP